MKYNNKLELIEAIKDNSNLFVEEYSDIEEVSINIIDKEIEYSSYQMLAFCIGWMDLVLSWDNEERKGIKEPSLATE